MARYYAPTKLSDNIRETPEGYLICLSVPIGRTGSMLYSEEETPLEGDSDGKVWIDRTADELFSPATMASFEGKPFTIRHPREFVVPSNWSQLTKGIIQNVRRSPDKDSDGEQVLLADILVTDSLAIQLIKSGVREVSCGYDAVYEQKGEGRGIQTNIFGNHLALVEQGRAGPSYAINDHKTERFKTMGFKEKLKLHFAKAIDEATIDEKEDMKEEKESTDKASYDELVKAVKDLGSRIESMGKPKDESKEDDKKEESKDEEVAPGLEERLKALEMAVSKIMESMSDKSEIITGDEGDDNEEDVGDEDPSMTGDTASRAEILSPGIKMTKDVKVKALKSSYSTKEGRKVIDSLTGGKSPSYDSAEKVSHLFIAASEILKASRGTGLSRTKDSSVHSLGESGSKRPTTAEELNKINEAYWSQRKGN